MEDKPYRPTRKPIDPSEVRENPIEEITEVKKERPEVSPSIPSGEVPFSGNVPPEFMKDIQASSEAPSRPKMPPSREEELPRAPGGYQVDNKLQMLLEKVQQKTHHYEEVTLPSLGRFYTGADGPTDGILHVRPMTGKEEEILATPRFVKKGEYLDMIFKNCVQESYDPKNFLVIDREYLLIYLRGISYTPNYDAELRCPMCEHKFQETIDLDSLYVNYCPDDFDVSILKDKLPVTEIDFSFHPSRGSDEKKIQNYRQRKRDFDTNNQSDDILLYRLAIQIDQIGGLTDSLSIKRLLQNLPINDVSYLRNTIMELPFGVDTSIEIACPACSADFEIELPMDVSFFFPRTKKKNQSHH